MARDHARILTSIQDDPHARQLSPLEQWAYAYVILARKDINSAGVVQYNPRAWAKTSKGATEDLVLEQLRGLIAAGFILVDEETDELMVRSFMRNDGIAKQPNMLVSACRYAVQVASPLLRAALARELRRIAADPAYRMNGPSSQAVHDAVGALDPEGPPPPPILADPPSAKGSTKGSAKTSGKPSGRRTAGAVTDQPPLPRSEDFPEPFPEGSGVGDGVGDGAPPSVEENLGGRAHTRARPAPHGSSGPRTDQTFPVQACGRPHDPEPACAPCGVAKRAGAADADADARRTAEARAARRAAIDACASCDELGQVHDPDDTCPGAVRCDHTTHPRLQLARARGAAS